MSKYIITSESVGSGHPDKVADFISDSVLDACLSQDPNSRVACETLVKSNTVVLAGEITTRANINYENIVKKCVAKIGYCTPEDDPVFNAENLNFVNLITEQSPDIAMGVDTEEQGAGDQGIMFGYATDETPSLMPLPISLAHSIMIALEMKRKTDDPKHILRPDSKCQVAVEYEDGKPVRIVNVVLSTQHSEKATLAEIRELGINLIKSVIDPSLITDDTKFFINPTGRFVIGGPQADTGLTGRKIIVDTYGGVGRHGGGAFSGKDCSKVDRSAAYMCRYVAKKLVSRGMCHWCEIQVAYAIGVADPVSIRVTSDGDNQALEKYVRENFSFRPKDIIQKLHLRNPIFRATTNYGHFGKPNLPWEQV